jgi:hypothetical protein
LFLFLDCFPFFFFFSLFFSPTAPRDREGEPRGGGVTVGVTARVR